MKGTRSRDCCRFYSSNNDLGLPLWWGGWRQRHLRSPEGDDCLAPVSHRNLSFPLWADPWAGQQQRRWVILRPCLQGVPPPASRHCFQFDESPNPFSLRGSVSLKKNGEPLGGTDHRLPGTGWAPRYLRLTQEADSRKAKLWKLRPRASVQTRWTPGSAEVSGDKTPAMVCPHQPPNSCRLPDIPQVRATLPWSGPRKGDCSGRGWAGQSCSLGTRRCMCPPCRCGCCCISTS